MSIIGRGQITVHIAENGAPGDPGQPGTSSYLHVRYSANSNGNPMTTTPNTYIGISVTNSETAPTSYTEYAWSQLAGRNGSDGIPGTSSYIHIRYSDYWDGYQMKTSPAAYIGVVITTSPIAPVNYNAYTWARFQGDKGDKGDKGDTGETGPRGPQGPQGATGSAGTSGPGIVYRGVFSPWNTYYNNHLRRDIVNYGGTYYIYKGRNDASASWNYDNWENFGAHFTSVATELLLARLAYIENLGVRNLRTSATGQRVEITQDRNSIAFYTNDQTDPDPVLEIKTTSDPMYMGQGAGFQIKQPGVNISIFKGYQHSGAEGSGISIPALPWGYPETIAQVSIGQSYTNSGEGKFKTGLYISMSGPQGTSDNSDKINAIHLESGGIFVGGAYNELRSNNVLAGVFAAGTVNTAGSLVRSWVLSFMGGYLTCTKTGTGRYRIGFSNQTYTYGCDGYNVLVMANGPIAGGGNGAYGCTMARTNSYFDVWMADDSSPNDCGFTFIVILTSKFWGY